MEDCSIEKASLFSDTSVKPDGRCNSLHNCADLGGSKVESDSEEFTGNLNSPKSAIEGNGSEKRFNCGEVALEAAAGDHSDH